MLHTHTHTHVLRSGAICTTHDTQPSSRDVGVTFVERWLEVDSMYLYIKPSQHSPEHELALYRRDLDAAYDHASAMLVLRCVLIPWQS